MAAGYAQGAIPPSLPTQGPVFERNRPFPFLSSRDKPITRIPGTLAASALWVSRPLLPQMRKKDNPRTRPVSGGKKRGREAGDLNIVVYTVSGYIKIHASTIISLYDFNALCQ